MGSSGGSQSCEGGWPREGIVPLQKGPRRISSPLCSLDWKSSPCLGAPTVLESWSPRGEEAGTAAPPAWGGTGEGSKPSAHHGVSGAYFEVSADLLTALLS